MSGFEIVPIRLSETCQNISGHVKCPYTVIRRTSPFLLQLETRLTKVTRESWDVPCRHRSRRCLSCWRAAMCSWPHSLVLFVCRCWAIIHGLPIRQRPVDAVFAPVQIGFYSRLNVCRVSLGYILVGRSLYFSYSTAKRTLRMSTKLAFPTTIVSPVAKIALSNVQQDGLAHTV